MLITTLIEYRIPFVVIETTTIGELDRFVAIETHEYDKGRKKKVLPMMEHCEGVRGAMVESLFGKEYEDFRRHKAKMSFERLGERGTAYFLPDLKLERDMTKCKQ